MKLIRMSVLPVAMLDQPDADSKRKVAAIFVSDLHLGTRSSQDRHFLDFLKAYDAQTLYLVGDLIDGWRLRRSGWYWPQGHNDVLQKLLRKARKGMKIIYIPGNHDEFLRNFLGLKFGGVKIVDRTVHTTVHGKRFLVLHGDQFDMVVRHAVWLASVGDVLYDVALWLNRQVNGVRRRLGFTLLVAVGLGQAQGEAGGELYGPLRGGAGGGGAARRRRRHRLRPYPPCGDRRL